ncbi:FtsX-like permease family protein [Polymorphospora sp. NPDC051019]|uniref:FtsX-like permease family protein n=1 Tax=Polymorphospora sp. NPDC051019 TaxID=3155725 RepID=UPI00344AEE8C
MSRWLWLGLRLSVGSGRAGMLRTVLMASGAAIGVFTVLAGLAGATVAVSQQERTGARTPVRVENGPGQLRMIEIEDGIGTRVLRRTALTGATADSPRPPGVDAYPGPGEVVLSPALADLIRVDERAADRFPQRVVGVIGPAGLVAPDELRAYVGVPAGDPMLDGDEPFFRDSVVVGFGAPPTFAHGSAYGTGADVFTPGRWLAAAFALFVLVPFGAFLATCARLSATTRDRRIAALRLLGVSARQATLVNVVETGVVAAGGALLGAAVFAVLAPLSQGWRIGRLHWYVADIALPAGWIAAVLAGTVLFAVLVGVLAARPARSRPLSVRRGGSARRPAWWRSLPLVCGLGAVVFAATDAAPLTPSGRGTVFIVGLLVTGLALPLVLPLLAYWLAVAVGRIPNAPVWLGLAAARVRHTPGVAPRLVASLAVTLFVIGMGSLGAALFTDRNLGDERLSPLYQVVSNDPGVVDALRAVPGTTLIEDGFTPVTLDGRHDSVLITDCADVIAMHTLGAGQTCVDGETYQLLRPGSVPLRPDAEVTAENGVRIPVPRHALELTSRYGVEYGNVLLVTSQAPIAADLPVRPGIPWLFAPDRESLDRAARIVSARAPAGYLNGDLGIHTGIDSDLLFTLLVAGLSISLLLGMGSFAAAAVDRAVERRRDNATLAVVGVRPAVIAGGETGFGGLPLVVGVGAAAAATIVVGASLAAVLDTPTAAVFGRIAPILLLGAGATVVGLILIAVPAWFTQRITAEQLRRP